MRNGGTKLGELPLIFICLLIFAISTQTSFADLIHLPFAVDKGAVCLDGSPPAFQLDKGIGGSANNWLIHLEGGGWCSTMEDCKSRKLTGHGSSKRMVPYKMTGILSYKRLYNPYFYDWTRVLVRYCDGSSYTGDVEEVDPNYKLYFRGQRIFTAIMEHLWNIGMHKAENAILSGCSAGGVGSILHCDQFRSMLSPTAKVKCISDGGYFIHTKDVSGQYFMENIFDGVVRLHGSAKNLPQSCTSKMKPSLCYLPVNSVPTVETPLFIVNSIFDTWQISINLASNKADTLKLWSRCKWNLTDCSPAQLETLRGFRDDFLRQLNAGVGVGNNTSNRGMFINSCRTHCQTEFQFKWLGDRRSKLDGKAVSDVVGEWFYIGKWFYNITGYHLIDNANTLPVECAMNPQEPGPYNRYSWLPWAT